MGPHVKYSCKAHCLSLSFDLACSSIDLGSAAGACSCQLGTSWVPAGHRDHGCARADCRRPAHSMRAYSMRAHGVRVCRRFNTAVYLINQLRTGDVAPGLVCQLRSLAAGAGSLMASMVQSMRPGASSVSICCTYCTAVLQSDTQVVCYLA